MLSEMSGDHGISNSRATNIYPKSKMVAQLLSIVRGCAERIDG